jgi:hypothetical protein
MNMVVVWLLVIFISLRKKSQICAEKSKKKMKSSNLAQVKLKGLLRQMNVAMYSLR